MDAASCLGVAPSALLSRSFADAAIARALHFSLSGSPPIPEPYSTATATDVLAPCADAVNATVRSPRAAAVQSSARCRLGPAGTGRAGKRRPRPSKRVPTTYISTDAATFRFMVQHVTGAQAEPQDDDGSCIDLLAPPFGAEPCTLPPEDPAASAAHFAAYLPRPPASAAEQPCFPTLDSWNVMCGKNEVV